MLYRDLTLNELTIVLGVFYLLIVIAILFFIIAPHSRIVCGTVIVITLVVLPFGIAKVNNDMRAVGSACVVIAKDVEAKYEPFQSATTFFRLNEGDKVAIVDTKDGWDKVKRDDGNVGWVQDKLIETI